MDKARAQPYTARKAQVRARQVDTFCRDMLPQRVLWPEMDYTGVPELAYPPRLNCATELLDTVVAARKGNRTAFYFSGRRWTYNDIFCLSNKVARVFVEDFELIPGNRVLLSGPNSPLLVACWLAVIKAGCVAVCTTSMLRARELASIIQKAHINLCLTDGRTATECDEAVAALGTRSAIPVVRFNSTASRSLDSRAANKDSKFDNYDTAADDVAIIAFTSGTTGDPKATMHFQRDLLAVADCFGRYLVKPTSDDILCGTPPLAFTFGLGGLLLFPMRFGASAVLLEHGSPLHLLEAVQTYRATICFTSPTGYRAMLGMLHQFDVSSLRKCISAGEVLPLSTFEAWNAATGLKIIDGIGSTELLHIFVSAADRDIRPGSTGKPVPGYRVCVLDETGNQAPAGTVGRLAVRGPTGCRYLGDPERQRQYVQGGWNVTGDAYRMDEDGYFWYQARIDDMIISAGYNIAGPEVENVLLEHPKVAECAVIGVPDSSRGQIVKAFVVVNENVTTDAKLVKDLQDFVKARIAPYKYPRAIKFLDRLPRTVTGKLQRHLLRGEA